MSLLISAGEASGDRLASLAVAHLRDDTFGMGGACLRAVGTHTVVDAADVAVTGVVEVARHAPALVRAWRVLDAEIDERRPAASLLVDYPGFHRWLAARLTRARIPVIWCVAPQVWAWRASRAPAFARSMSRLAVLFRHEVALWQRLGVPTRWVGHPAAEAPARPRSSSSSPRVALLVGSRVNVVRAHLSLFSEVARRLGDAGARVSFLVSPALPVDARAAIALAAAAVGATARVCPPAGASSLLGDVDAALVTAGTTSLEVALAGVPAVVAHRVSPITAAVARRWLRTRWVALPNIVAARAVIPELLQDAATPDAISRALLDALRVGAPQGLADELRAALSPSDGATFGLRVASLIGDGA